MTIESIPQLPAFRNLSKEKQKYYQKLAEPSGFQKWYWEDVYRKYTAIPTNQRSQKVDVLVNAIKETPRKFTQGGGVILRRMYYHLGHTIERIATFDVHESDESAQVGQLFMAAAECYITADEVLGVWSEYANRAINCLSAAGRADLAQDLATQIYGSNTRVITDESEDAKEIKALMKRAKSQRTDDFGNRIYNINLPATNLN